MSTSNATTYMRRARNSLELAGQALNRGDTSGAGFQLSNVAHDLARAFDELVGVVQQLETRS